MRANPEGIAGAKRRRAGSWSSTALGREGRRACVPEDQVEAVEDVGEQPSWHAKAVELVASRGAAPQAGGRGRASPRPRPARALASSAPPELEPEDSRPFWEFVTQALLGAEATDAVCRTFELGGTIDSLGDVAFVREEITAHFLAGQDLHSVIWHVLLICWLGGGGPRHQTYLWLRKIGLASKYIAGAGVAELYRRVLERTAKLGWAAVFHGDSTAVRFRLDTKLQGEALLSEWHEAVPRSRC